MEVSGFDSSILQAQGCTEGGFQGLQETPFVNAPILMCCPRLPHYPPRAEVGIW